MKAEGCDKRRVRGRRLASGLNVCLSLLLAAAAFAMVNYLASRRYWRWDISRRGYYQLSDKTKSMLAGLDTDISAIAVFGRNHELYDDIKSLLAEYKYQCVWSRGATFKVEIVDPDRDLARARELTRDYDLHKAGVIIFEAAGRRKYVESDDLVDYEYFLRGDTAAKRIAGFKGEQAFSSAIQSVIQAARPVVYFLGGHGERDIEDFGRHTGYSTLARAIRRDNIEVRRLILAEQGGIPKDCSALIIAGVSAEIAAAEAAMLAEYLDKDGRLLLLADPGTTTGLAGLLERWGIRLGAEVVVGLTLTGRELVVTEYGDHPATRNLKNLTTMFHAPRAIYPAGGRLSVEEAQPDKPRIVALASCTEAGWAETDTEQNPPKYDPGKDRSGPVPVAVAVEKGTVSVLDVEIKPMRMVIIGDSFFVSNGTLRSIGGNIDFFMSALNWLLDREFLMAIAPKDAGELRLDMTGKQLRTAYCVIVGVMPGAAALLAVAVWWRRRY